MSCSKRNLLDNVCPFVLSLELIHPIYNSNSSHSYLLTSQFTSVSLQVKVTIIKNIDNL